MNACRHCGAGSTRPRGLCSRCYNTAAVRGLYPAEGRAGLAGATQREPELTPLYPASRACPYRPGSVGKVLWLAARYERRERLYHTHDAGG